jgi:hypothetical protein
MAHHACMASHQYAIYIYVSPNSLPASPTAPPICLFLVLIFLARRLLLMSISS